MYLVNKELLQKFQLKHSDARLHIKTWREDVSLAKWRQPLDVKATYPKASIIDSENVVFNIRGNKYRLWVRIDYSGGIVYIERIGTHDKYMKWNIK